MAVFWSGSGEDQARPGPWSSRVAVELSCGGTVHNFVEDLKPGLSRAAFNDITAALADIGLWITSTHMAQEHTHDAIWQV